MERSALECLPDDLHLPHLQMLSIDWRVLLASHHVLPRQPALQVSGVIHPHTARNAAFLLRPPAPTWHASAAHNCPPCLQHLLLGSMLARALPFMEGPAGGDADSTLPSLGRCAALRTVTVLVYNSPGGHGSGAAVRALQADELGYSALRRAGQCQRHSAHSMPNHPPTHPRPMHAEALVSPAIVQLLLQAGRACPHLALQAQDSASFFLTDSEHLAAPAGGEEAGGDGEGGGDPPAEG